MKLSRTNINRLQVAAVAALFLGIIVFSVWFASQGVNFGEA
jgi:hypothetical protein